jgi:hypothetical protein
MTENEMKEYIEMVKNEIDKSWFLHLSTINDAH